MKRSLFIFGILFFVLTANAQLGINVGLSELKFTGDVGKNGNSNFLNDARSGFNGGLEYRTGKVLGFGLSGVYGKLVGTDNNAASHKNFATNIMGGEFNVFLFFDRLKDTAKIVSPFISAGIGYLKFDPKGDLRDVNGTAYNYWSDGSIRNLVESTSNEPIAQKMKRDYNYETTLTDSAVNYKRSCLYLPINVGAKFQIGYRTSIRLSLNYNIAFTDYIDNYKSGGNDSWLGMNTCLSINLGKKPHDVYSNVDFSIIDQSDWDGDGVIDLHDYCQGTPKGIAVDSHGCPPDADGDDVPDYLDKEVNSKRGAKVDGHGVTINEEELARLQMELDALFGGREEAEQKSQPK